MGISRQRNSGYKAEQVNYCGTAQGLSNSLPRSFLSPYTHLFLGWALIRLQASGLAESITRKERGRAASTLHTHRQASLMVSHYTTLVPALKAVHWASSRSRHQHWYVKGNVPHRKKERRKKLTLIVFVKF